MLSAPNNLVVNFKPTLKQIEAFDYLCDKETTELLYGGGAGGGKSYLGCCWLIISSMQYAGTRWLMGRAVLKSLKESTLLTFFQICKLWGLIQDVHYRYNSIEGTITFWNGSQIYLKDLFAYPSDPEFDELGSTEYTGAFLDEVSQITNKAKNIVTSRLRYKLEEYHLVPKILFATNPSKNWAYSEFYKPAIEGTLPSYRKFIPALVTDNFYMSPHYIENLKKLDMVSRERLLYGNWNYDDDPTALFEYDKLLDMFSNVPILGTKYVSVDVARFGSDKTTIFLWNGLFLEHVYYFTKQSIEETRKFILKLCQEKVIPLSNVIIDEDGVGGGLVDTLLNVKGFVNNATQIVNNVGFEPNKYNFANLKSQCYFLLSDFVLSGKISIYKDIDPKIKEMLVEELEQIKRKDADKDSKMAVISKDIMKENLGRSPDFADALMMRMYFELGIKKSCWFFG